MKRPIALALAVCATACAPAESASDTPAHAQPGQKEQGAGTLATSEANAIRFLEQATFGPRRAQGTGPLPIDSVEQVAAVGITQSITAQFNAPRSTFDAEATADLSSQFFSNAIQGEDQLRQRVAFALSQIFVVSQNGIPNPQGTPENEPRLAMAGYLNLLSQRAFGNFRQLLEAITLDPAMGTYLDMANNKAFKANGQPVQPNENYAREMLQLFTLGLHQLNEDGTEKRDANDELIPAYTEEQVQAFAAALSGWTYASGTGCPTVGRSNPPSYPAPMIGCDANHDSSARRLLRGQMTTAGAGATRHLTEALDNVFADPNLPPFICKQLIQHLVTSNPSPAYVQRVVDAFKSNGNGVRGDLRFVVRKILEDSEARGSTAPSAQQPTYGHLRSPALFVTTAVRWLNGTLDTTGGKDPGAKLSNWSRAMGQFVPRSPSVFSYYPPNAPAPGANGLLGPEFAILDTATVTARANFVHELLYANTAANAGILIDLNTVPSAPTDLVAWLDHNLLHDTMSADLQLVLQNSLADPRAGDTTRKKKLALYLTTLSPEFQIQR
ncbi:DUF1800 domain-containing protein [Melittangium boletus]|uniref:DUF1800 domain-containing protein n=1 Tax=Melittangium boletus DSM 14713 TaxID=1294270 RepID=A0A250IMC7_9BACT|nr:DUF1800 family protein [Melittangium boletus]ATB32894.1 hypothetical protein MEBOL_006383 [Melittangium boletus DSM 14713]